MQSQLYRLDGNCLATLNNAHTQETIEQLETGHVLYCHQLPFVLMPNESVLFDPKIADTRKKNISYDYQQKNLKGVSENNPHRSTLETMMHRYAEFAKNLVDNTLPHYQSTLRWGRTSYRPAEVLGRHRSKRQDDTRVHVDAFPSTPVHGSRILRVFCNINLEGKARVWELGEPFERVARRFYTQLPRYNRYRAKLLHLLKTTKTLRSAYDHTMLSLHDAMKLDDHYQHQLSKEQVHFSPQSTWIVYTDQVSHAALSGQYLLEQTFYLPIEAMQNPEHAPSRVIEKIRLITN